MGFIIETPEIPKDTTLSGIVWFVYMGLAGLIWLIFVWDEALIPAMLSPDVREYLVDLARIFPGPNGRFLSLIEHGYPDIAQNYSLYFSINLLFFVGYFVSTIFVLFIDKKTSENTKKISNIKILLLIGGSVMVILVFIIESIDYNNESIFFSYKIYKGSYYYYIDLVGWGGLFGVASILAIKLKLAIRVRIMGEK